MTETMFTQFLFFTGNQFFTGAVLNLSSLTIGITITMTVIKVNLKGFSWLTALKH
jgi:hypothetical protein